METAQKHMGTRQSESVAPDPEMMTPKEQREARLRLAIRALQEELFMLKDIQLELEKIGRVNDLAYKLQSDSRDIGRKINSLNVKAFDQGLSLDKKLTKIEIFFGN